jgi:hypothetical protein
VPVHPPQDEVLGLGAIRTAHSGFQIAQIGTGHGQIGGEAKDRIGASLHGALWHEWDQREQSQWLIGRLACRPQSLPDGGLHPGQIRGYLLWVDADTCKGSRVGAVILHGALAGGYEQSNGAIGTLPPRAFAQFRREPGKQRMAPRAKGIRARIPLVKIDVNGDSRHNNIAVGVVADQRSGSRCLGPEKLMPALEPQFRRRTQRPGNFGCSPQGFTRIGSNGAPPAARVCRRIAKTWGVALDRIGGRQEAPEAVRQTVRHNQADRGRPIG